MREVVSRRHLALQRSVAKRTGADPLQVRTFFATGLVVTISTVLAMFDRRTDATWRLATDLVDPTAPPNA